MIKNRIDYSIATNKTDQGDQVFQAIHCVWGWAWYINVTNAIGMYHEETKWCKLTGKAALSSMQPFFSPEYPEICETEV